MYDHLHHTLARDRMREDHRRAREATVARELAAAKRWRWVTRLAQRVERRHVRRADWALAR